MRRRLVLGLGLASAVLGGLALTGCRSSIPRRNPTGEVFPSVVGESLEGQEVRLPEDFAGAPVLLLVGYKQSSQFDLDRWLMGLTMAEVDVAVREVPTIPGLAILIVSLGFNLLGDGLRDVLDPKGGG